MNIQKINSFVDSKITKIKRFILPSKPEKVNYGRFVKISKTLDKDTFVYLNKIKSTLGNYAKHNRLIVIFEELEGISKKAKMNVYKMESRFLERFYDAIDFPHDEPVKLNKKDIIIDTDVFNGEKFYETTKNIYNKVADIFQSSKN